MTDINELEPILGVPYAHQEIVGRRVFAICPRCAARIELTGRKDFESAAVDPYVTHYFAEHASADGLVKYGDRWYRRRPPRV
jgi:hypothetical protein